MLAKLPTRRFLPLVGRITALLFFVGSFNTLGSPTEDLGCNHMRWLVGDDFILFYLVLDTLNHLVDMISLLCIHALHFDVSITVVKGCANKKNRVRLMT